MTDFSEIVECQTVVRKMSAFVRLVFLVRILFLQQKNIVMRRLKICFCLLVCLSVSVDIKAQHTVSGVVCDTAEQPVVVAAVTLKSLSDTLYYKKGVTNGQGKFVVADMASGVYRLEVSSLGYSAFCRELKLDQSVDVGKVVLTAGPVALNEVVVTSETVRRFADRREYRLTRRERERYSSALSALEFLPKIQVQDQSVSLTDGKAVKIMLNGIPSTPADLSVVAPENIVRIDYYTRPPLRYSNLGLGAVVNVVTREPKNGGTLGLNTQNAVTTGFGNNVVNFRYNWGRSQIGVTYQINYRNYHQRMLDEHLAYTIGGIRYEKDKYGHRSPYAYEQQMAEISFNRSQADSYLLSAKLSLHSLNRRRSSMQDIISRVEGVGESRKTGESSDRDRYVSPVMDVYFSKSWHDRHELSLNVVGTRYDSDYDYEYKEWTDDAADFETFTVVRADKYSLIGEALYGYKMKKASLRAGTRYAYNRSTQRNIPSPNRILTHEAYSYLGVEGMCGPKFNYSVSAGVNNGMFIPVSGRRFRFVSFRPQVKWGYFISKSSDLTFNYEVNTENPSVSLLTANPYHKDPHCLFVGNPDLKPATLHDFTLSYFKGFRKWVLNAECGYSYARKAIAPVFRPDGADIVETFGNLDRAQHMKCSLFMQWYPFASQILRLRLFAEVFYQQNQWNGARWNHTGYSVIPSLYLAYRKWGLQLFYQTGKKSLVGQTTKHVPSMASVELSCKHVKNLSLTGGIRYPFYDAWKQVTAVSGTTLLSRTETERILNNANMVYFNLVYHFQFGQLSKGVRLKLQNEDKDSGILNRN